MGVAVSARDGISVRAHDTERGKLSMLFQSTLPLRFWRKVYADPSGCWLWRASLNNWGYGKFRWNNRDGVAHRVAYEVLVGPIPTGRQIDHLCRTPKCVRPDHLEPVTVRENVLRGVGLSAANARKTHCPQGHPYDLLNTGPGHKGQQRVCRKCQAIRMARWRQRVRGY